MMLSLMSTSVDLAYLPITDSGGVSLDCLILCQHVLDVPLLVLFIVCVRIQQQPGWWRLNQMENT